MTQPRSAQTIGVAMSGGVDSTVAARLLVEQGYRVHGFFMLLPLPGLDRQIKKVKLVADHLHIPLHFIDLQEKFTDSIITYFIDSYKSGLTPNPCVVCNERIKCGQLLDEMAARGMDQMATGHYAQVLHNAELHRAADSKKDQSYFLCRLDSRQLARLILPLGNWQKRDVYERAVEMGFTHFNGQESQDVCFLSGKNLPDFLQEQNVKNCPGEITTRDGEVLGRHRGIWHYTVGQRRGLGLPDATPWYVTGLDPEHNRVLIGKNESLFKKRLRVTDVHWHIPKPLIWEGDVQLRSRHRAAPARIVPTKNGDCLIDFSEPQRALSPGQFAVFYKKNRVVGSAIIQRDYRLTP